MIIGLRIDVDTYRGTKYGVPRLCGLFASHAIKATFFFSVGPDNMGRHLWRLLRPSFLNKMLRTRAARLYGWDILLRGTLWPGPVIGKRLGDIIRAAAEAGHEIGLHAWDHHVWQRHIDAMSRTAIRDELNKGVRMLTEALGKPPTCSAAPAWKCNADVLLEKNNFPFTYNSDCRGEGIFFPVVAGQVLDQPQIPVSLPTYDEVIGRDGISDDNYNDYMLSLIHPDSINVLAIHAEVEGLARSGLFERFLKKARIRGITFVPLGSLLDRKAPVGHGVMINRTIAGREGMASWAVPVSEARAAEQNETDGLR